MKLAMQLTIDGLVRALRMKGHALADDAEAGYRRADAAEETSRGRVRHGPARETDDDRARS
jgi:hypothetical protein